MKEHIYILAGSTIVACLDLYKDMLYWWQLLLAGIIITVCVQSVGTRSTVDGIAQTTILFVPLLANINVFMIERTCNNHTF